MKPKVDELFLVECEPLHTHIAMMEAMDGVSRSQSKEAVSSFVRAMQQDDKAAMAAKKWAYLVFKDILSDEDSFGAVDGGEQLYKTFFEYQSLLYKGWTGLGTFDKVGEYRTHIIRMGIGALKLKDYGAGTQHLAGGGGSGGGKSHNGQRSFRSHKASGPKSGRRQLETSVHRSNAGLTRSVLTEATHAALTELTGDVTVNSSSRPTMGQGNFVNLNDASPVTNHAGTRPPVLPVVRKSSKGSASKRERKRKAYSQKPSVITPSDASEDDGELSEIPRVTVSGFALHQSKRFAPNPRTRSPDLFAFNIRADKNPPVHRLQANKQHRIDASISQRRSTLTNSRSDEFVPPPNIKGRHGAEFPLNGRKHGETRVSNLSTEPTRTSVNAGMPRKMKSAGDLQAPAPKRPRRASMSALNGKLGQGSESTYGSQGRALQEPTTQGPIVTGRPLALGNISVESNARRKRTRLEFETGIVVSHDETSADSHESLGPDIRSSRPHPQKLRDRRPVLVVDEDTAHHGVLYGAPSLKHADHLLRDAACHALAIPREADGPDMPDWTLDSGHDAEWEDSIYGHDQDETNDVQAATATSATSMVISKPPVPARPEIWAQSRQEVCESFEYFRCYHSGVYSKDDIVKGYLLGAYAASRDIFHHSGKLIISHGGGKSESVLESRRKPKRYQTDQDQEASDKSVRALLKTCNDRRPVVLLADDKYALFPYDLASDNYTYVVLGFYWISHAWAECQPSRDRTGRIVRWKFAFQWCEEQGSPWWESQHEETDMTLVPPKSVSNSGPCPPKDLQHSTDTSGDPSIRCKNCREQSPFVYKQGWMCLNPRCNVFWSINGEDPKELDYREEFLTLLPRRLERLPNLTPTRVAETPGGITTTYTFSKGWHCEKCGRLSCRYKWEQWECSNCHFKHVVHGRIRSPKEFWHQRPPKGFLHSQIGKGSGILASRLEPINLGACKGLTNCLTFILPHERGRIHLILGTPLSNGEADSIFELYQQQASIGELKLRRYPLRNHRARGLLLTNYFSQNSGEPYQYVGGTGNTVPLVEAPGCVQRALALIKGRAGLALRSDVPFNEVLSAAYMERQKMSFHSDSEKGLGPIVASLSLGSTALMHFRPHVNVEDTITKGTYALTLVLRHGDVLIMEGEGVQKYYEHTVVPMNFRIAATARCIGTA